MATRHQVQRGAINGADIKGGLAGLNPLDRPRCRSRALIGVDGDVTGVQGREQCILADGDDRSLGNGESGCQVETVVGRLIADRDCGGIEQPFAALPVRGGEVRRGECDELGTAGFDEAAVAAGRTAAHADLAVGLRGFVAPENDLAAVASLQRVGDNPGVLAEVGLLRVDDIGIAPVHVAADQRHSAACIAGDIDDPVIGDADLVAEDFDRAALFAFGLGRGIEHAGTEHLALGRGAVAIKNNLATGVVDAGRLDGAAVGNIAAVRREEDLAVDLLEARRRNVARVVDRQGIGIAAGGLQLGAGRTNRPRIGDAARLLRPGRSRLNKEVLVARLLEENFRARREPGVALGGQNLPRVLDFVGNEIDVTAGGLDHPGVVDLTVCAAEEMEIAALEEIVVRDVQGRADEARRIDASSGAHHDAAGVDEVNLAVGLEGAVDGGKIAADHPIQRGGRGVGDHELGRLAMVDRESLPVDDGILTTLVDRQRFAR